MQITNKLLKLPDVYMCQIKGKGFITDWRTRVIA